MKCAHCGYDGKKLVVDLIATGGTLVVIFLLYFNQARLNTDRVEATRQYDIAPEAS